MEMDQKVAFRHLTKRIAIDQQPLSYRVASRELGITIQDAKLLLAAFLDDPSTQARGITATYCLYGQVATQPKEDDDDDHAMDLDSQHTSQSASSPLTSIILLVPQAEREAAQNRFLTPPQSHVYALHSTPLASTSDLSVHTLPLLSTEALRAKWKPIPLGGYGEIVHPNGERKKSSSQTTRNKAFTNKSSTSAKPNTTTTTTTTTLLGTKLESTKTSTSNSDIPSSKSTKKPATSTVRKIGQPGGLFARREPTPPPAVPPKVVPSKKRKASPKKKQNGLFADEELASDEDEEEEEEEEDLWDEEALREAEEMALKGDTKTKTPAAAAAAAVETKKKETASVPKKAVVPAAAPVKKFGAGSSTTAGAKAGASKPAQQKGIGSFFTKKA